MFRRCFEWWWFDGGVSPCSSMDPRGALGVVGMAHLGIIKAADES